MRLVEISGVEITVIVSEVSDNGGNHRDINKLHTPSYSGPAVY